MGDAPYFLLILTKDGHYVIDVEERGWHARFADLMREPGTWYLCRKVDRAVVFSVMVHEGEQPYYVARHIGIATGVGFNPITGRGSPEIIAYGIGKKRRDGHVDRLWIINDGLICAGDDVDQLALEVLKAGG